MWEIHVLYIPLYGRYIYTHRIHGTGIFTYMKTI